MSPAPMELIVIAIIALIVLGPNKLPDAAASLGKGLREMRESFAGKDDDDVDLPEYADEDDDVDEPDDDLEADAASVDAENADATAESADAAPAAAASEEPAAGSSSAS